MKPISSLYELFLNSSGVSIDSRTLKEGELFFALKGDRFDGHRFLESVLDKGAVAMVIDDESYSHLPNSHLVNNAAQSLQKLARHHRSTFDIPVLGITGSNGKTTTKELIAAVLSKKYRIHYTQGNLNNHLGVPLTLLSMSKDTEIAVIEMGANHIGEIDLLCNLADPGFGLITNIGKAHIGEFGSFEKIVQGKHELFDYVMDHIGFLFVNAEDAFINNDIVNEWTNSIFYTTNEITKSYDVASIKLIFNEYDLRTSISIETESEHIQIESLLYGSYNQPNIAAAIACGYYWSVPIQEIAHAIEHYIPTNYRSQIVKHGSNTIMLDTYNANPDSMKAAIQELIKTTANHKIVVLGDMLELGSYSQMEHFDLLSWVIDQQIDEIFVVGTEFPRLKGCKYFEDWKSMKQEVDLSSYEDTMILIKGSRKLYLENLLNDFR